MDFFLIWLPLYYYTSRLGFDSRKCGTHSAQRLFVTVEYIPRFPVSAVDSCSPQMRRLLSVLCSWALSASENLWRPSELKQDSLTGLAAPDMPPNTDCPYPIRIWAFFEMLWPYQILIRIWGKLWKIFFAVIFGCVAKEGQFCRRCNVIFFAKFWTKCGRPASSHR